MAKTAKWQGFMADHPGFTERIAAMRARIADAGMDTTIPAMPLPAE